MNFEDCAGRRALGAKKCRRVGFQPQRDRRRGRIGRGQPGRAAGGLFAAKARAAAVSSAVEAVVAVSTPTDLTALYHQTHYAGSSAARVSGRLSPQVPANYVAASPIDHVSPGDPPMLLIHGRQDDVIPVSQSERMHDALDAAGVRNQLILVNGGHDLEFPAHYSNLVPDVLEFLATTWKD